MVKISALILTEDGSKFMPETLQRVCGTIFDFIVPRCAVDACVSFRPTSDNERAAMTANSWRSSKSRDQPRLLSLCRSIATHLLRDDGFVFFHFDGDAIWGLESSATLTKYDAQIVGKVREIIRGHMQKTRGGDCSAVVDYAMRKLIHIAPFYSIESWLYANTTVLRTLCRISPEVEAHLTAWERDLSELDRAQMPKTLAPIDTAHHPTLAAKLPINRLVELGTSFCDTVIRTGNCSSLVIRLRHSWPTYVKKQFNLA